MNPTEGGHKDTGKVLITSTAKMMETGRHCGSNVELKPVRICSMPPAGGPKYTGDSQEEEAERDKL